MQLTIAQLNPLAGDIAHNADNIITAIETAKQQYSKLIIFPELALCGYPPEDLLLRDDFYLAVDKAMRAILQHTKNIYVVFGYPRKTADALYNSAVVMHQQKIIATYDKQCLPNYGVFDEKRYFTAGDKTGVIDIDGTKFGILICEDLWQSQPIAHAKTAGAEVILSLNASPFHLNKMAQRLAIMQQRQAETGLAIVYVNLVGGQDELIFAGRSFALNKQGDYAALADAFKEEILTITLDAEHNIVTQPLPKVTSSDAIVYDALVLAVKDYVTKNGFKGALLGLSGGIDSALTLAIAVDALGADNVQAVMMPSCYTADMSLHDAEQEAKNLQVHYSVIPIEKPVTIFNNLLKDEFEGLAADATEENIQARCRGVLLMAISNKSGKIVLTTGNKSEMAVGYATLYGDMAGGFAVLKDVPKMLVYQLARYRNSISPVIPERVIHRPPSAELAPDQLDENSLPPYSVLDAILEHYVEQDHSVADIVDAGFEAETVKHVVLMVQRNEYKRRQSAPGPRVTSRAYGRDRRYPITSGFKNNH